ncbi:MAG: ankyrin repeat domain-containing protein [Rubrivivax sp.]|nr:ankyrin repeat domain-containing protein [Rubrivivax sp.]
MKYYFRFVFYLVLAFGISSSIAGSYEDYFRALEVDDAGTVSGLLERGFDPNAPDENGQVGLYLALRDGALKVAATLLAHPELKVDAVNAADETPLMMAALRGNREWTQRLLDRGAQLNRSGWTPLHYAASGPEPKLLTLLLDRGALIEAASPNRTTPLMMAARYGAPGAAEALLARGADPRARNDLGLTAADFARQAGREALAASLQAAGR